MKSRKAAIAAGFAMGAAAKCGLSFASTIGTLFIGKAIDRLGNGVQVRARRAPLAAARRAPCLQARLFEPGAAARPRPARGFRANPRLAPAPATAPQAAPRDALIGDLSPAASRSACYGFAQSMRKIGSFVGAGLVFALMKATGNNYQVWGWGRGRGRGGGAGVCPHEGDRQQLPAGAPGG
jgi:hypothetical protein